jgi:hypothetical protein
MIPTGPIASNKMGRVLTLLRRPVFLFLVAAFFRFVVLSVIVARSPVWWGMNEAGGIARELVHGNGFASPFHDSTGPTAWLAPLYPTLLAGIFSLFGVQTLASAWAAAILNVLFSSVTALVVRQLGTEHFGESAGLVAGWAWALSPPLAIMPWLLWETCLSALVMSFGLLRLLRLNKASPIPDWLFCGCIWSFAALLNPALLAPLPILALRAIWKRCLIGSAAMILICALGVAPWTTRNVLRLHHLVPVRSNFWPELFFGNVSFSLHPTGDSMAYQREGEIAFAANLRKRVIDSVRSNPANFFRLTRQRVIAFWTGPSPFGLYGALLSLATLTGIVLAGFAARAWFSFSCVLMLYPLVYYLTFTFARYRHPIEPLMYALSGFALSELATYGKRWRAREDR